jgi:Dolichyl-phosphate-mannose-protein mannosyltransferase
MVVGALMRVLLLVCALGAVLRLIGLQYGLPHVYNPDEVAIMARALTFAKGTLNPGNFLYPTFFFYVLFAWVGVYLAGAWAAGRARSLAELQQLYFTDSTGIYTAGRLLGATAGTITIAAVYALARRVTAPRAAAAAALFVAVAPLHVRDSHYVKHDVPATLAIVLAYVAMLRAWDDRPARHRARPLALAAAACGVAFSTHYYCVFLAIPLLAVAWVADRDRRPASVLRRFAMVTAVSVGVFLLLSPFIVFEPATVWRDVTANREIVVDRAVRSGAFAPLAQYAEMLLLDTVGIPVVLLAAVGTVVMVRAQRAHALFLLSFPVPFLLFISNTFPASRYLNPIVPFVSVFAGYGLAVLVGRISSRPAVFWGFAVLAAAPALYDSLRTDFFIRHADTRTVAADVVLRTVPRGAAIALQPYSVPLEPTRESLERALQRNLQGAPPSAKFRIQLSRSPWPDRAYDVVYLGRGLDVEKTYVDYEELGGAHGLTALRRLGVTYVVVKRYNSPDPETQPFLASLAREGRRLAMISPYRADISGEQAAAIEPFLHNTDARVHPALERPGPALEIWQIDASGR